MVGGASLPGRCAGAVKCEVVGTMSGVPTLFPIVRLAPKPTQILRHRGVGDIAESDAEIDRLGQDHAPPERVSTGADTLSRWMAHFRD
eukprot:2844931-Prymnesium_polylepis.1